MQLLKYSEHLSRHGGILPAAISSLLEVIIISPPLTVQYFTLCLRSPHPSRSPHLPPGSRSPHLAPGSRSPMMSAPDRDPGNPLKVSIALGQKPAIIQKGPFYLMKPEPIVMSEVTGATNLMANKNLEHSFQKLAAKKMKDSLSSFLPGLPGMVDINSQQDNSSLRQVIEKPPVGGKELLLLNQVQLSGFR